MADCSFDLEIPDAIAASKLFSYGGCVMVRELLSPHSLAELSAEAVSAKLAGERNVLAISDDTEGRGGSPGRAFTSAHGGAVQWRLYNSPTLLKLLTELCDVAPAPTGGGTYSFYEQPGDFLAVHRDVLACDLAVITCLSDTGAASAGRGLLAYPGYIREPLSRVREAGVAAGTPVPLRRGDTVVLLGGIVPHEVAPIPPGSERIVSVMCYHLAASSNPLS